MTQLKPKWEWTSAWIYVDEQMNIRIISCRRDDHNLDNVLEGRT